MASINSGSLGLWPENWNGQYPAAPLDDWSELFPAVTPEELSEQLKSDSDEGSYEERIPVSREELAEESDFVDALSDGKSSSPISMEAEQSPSTNEASQMTATDIPPLPNDSSAHVEPRPAASPIRPRHYEWPSSPISQQGPQTEEEIQWLRNLTLANQAAVSHPNYVFTGDW